MKTKITATEEKKLKEVLAHVMVIMFKYVTKYGSTEESWDKIKREVKCDYMIDEQHATILMRAAESIYLGELHPAFK